MEIETNMLGTEVTAESTTAEQVINYDTLTKKELITIVEQLNRALDNYKTVKENADENHKKELEDCTDYYSNKLKEVTSLVKYYERKFKLLGDILTIETGGER